MFWWVQVKQLNKLKIPDKVPWPQSNEIQTKLTFAGLIYLSAYSIVFIFKEFEGIKRLEQCLWSRQIQTEFVQTGLACLIQVRSSDWKLGRDSNL